MSVSRARLALAMAISMLLGACARAPTPGEPLAQGQLEQLIDEIASADNLPSALRGSGVCEVTAQGRSYSVSFALLYSRPGWLRLDVRPNIGSLGAAFTALSVVDGECALTYLPQEGVALDGCLSDVLDGGSLPLDTASALAGVPDVSFIRALKGATAIRESPTLVIRGSHGDIEVTVRLEEDSRLVRAIALESRGNERGVTLSYSDHKVVQGASLPRTVKLIIDGDRGRRASAEFEYKRQRLSQDVDRDSYRVVLPPNVRTLGWNDLNR